MDYSEQYTKYVMHPSTFYNQHKLFIVYIPNTYNIKHRRQY